MWKDCYTQADTFEEAIAEVSSVVSSLTESYLEENMPILPQIVWHSYCAITRHSKCANNASEFYVKN